MKKNNIVKKIACLMLLGIVPFSVMACGGNKETPKTDPTTEVRVPSRRPGSGTNTATEGGYAEFKTVVENILAGQNNLKLPQSAGDLQSSSLQMMAVETTPAENITTTLNAAITESTTKLPVTGEPGITFLTQEQPLWYLHAINLLGYINDQNDNPNFYDVVFYDPYLCQAYMQVHRISANHFQMYAYGFYNEEHNFRLLDITYQGANDYQVQILGKVGADTNADPDWYAYFDSTGIAVEFGTMFRAGKTVWYCAPDATKDNEIVGYEIADDTVYDTCQAFLTDAYATMDQTMLENMITFPVEGNYHEFEKAEVLAAAAEVAPSLLVFLEN